MSLTIEQKHEFQIYLMKCCGPPGNGLSVFCFSVNFLLCGQLPLGSISLCSASARADEFLDEED